MLTFEEAKRIGTKACVNKLGYDFVKKYEETSCCAYSDAGDHVSCFVGVSVTPDIPWTGGPLVIDDSPEAKFPFSARCEVDYADGGVTFLECRLPGVFKKEGDYTITIMATRKPGCYITKRDSVGQLQRNTQSATSIRSNKARADKFRTNNLIETNAKENK